MEVSYNMSVFITSDLHGELRNFKSMLKLIDFQKEKDELYVLGDVLDRGSEGIELLSYIRQYSDYNNPAIRVIKGNHELFAQMYIEEKLSRDNWIKWGGKQTAARIDSMTNNERFDLLNYLKSLQHYAVIEREDGQDWVLSHSGIHLDFLIEDEKGIDVVQSIEAAIAYDEFEYLITNDLLYAPRSVIDRFKQYLIIGHVPVIFLSDGRNRIIKRKQYMCIDTGAGYRNMGGKMSIYRIEDEKEFYL